MLCFIFFVLLGLSLGNNAQAQDLRRVDDTELIQLLTGNSNVVVLFNKNNCQSCLEYENVVTKIYPQLQETLSTIVVQSVDSNLVSIYDPSKEPALVFFRRGIPILYHGEVNDDEILDFFNDNLEPAVKELSDDNFEHLTQASSGATTGDWFVFFYSAECTVCQRLYAVWESVGGKLKRKLNIARMNSAESGISTAKRLGALESPAFIFLRQGKMYRYLAKQYSPEAFVQFAEKGYLTQSHPQPVPQIPSAVNEFLGPLQSYFKSENITSLASLGIFALFAVFYLTKKIAKVFSSEPVKTKNKSK
ncbi:thioredoxin domain-containing protein isoform X1 [Drosophila gunungcola]|uniref:thioredoxin domain-containing protein isoform X1 n=2 Tax=Drosophila gunungcola TaxID=103775 RepID=UPI0022E0091C|nr:thioredoxin domain-containing protein isoform X1 [Drosophila gunungcola]